MIEGFLREHPIAVILVVATLVLYGVLWTPTGRPPVPGDVDMSPPDSPCRTLGTPPLQPGGSCGGPPHDLAPMPCPWAPTTDAQGIARLFEARAGSKCFSAGDVVLPTGRVVATDGLVASNGGPTEVVLAPGRYPVILAQTSDGFAAALLVVAAEPPSRWRRAHYPDGTDEYAFAVDAGTGSFMDLAAWCRLAFHTDAAWSPDQLGKEGIFGRIHFDRCADPRSGANAIVFASGIGDGVYPVLVGEDGRGRVVAVAIDFLLVDDTDG